MVVNKENLIFLKIKNKIISYIKSFRLSFWFLASVFFLLGEWYSNQNFPVNQTIIGLASLFGIFSAGSMMNIVFDKKIDIFARKHIVKIFNYISSKEILIASTFLSIISLLLLFFYEDLETFLLGLLIVVIGIFYSTPPIRLKTKPPFDCLMNALGGVIPFFIGWTIFSTPLLFESAIYGLIIFLFILHTFFFFTTSDIVTDKEIAIRTSSNLLGVKNSLIVGIIIFAIDLFVAFYFFEIAYLLLICLIIYIPFIILAFIYKNDSAILVKIVVGRSTSVFAGSILILLSIFSKNIFPIFFLMIWTFLTIYDIVIICKN